nr:PREDICTED: radial spoke head 10 homolog B2 [Paralichthys olivaceus]
MRRGKNKKKTTITGDTRVKEETGTNLEDTRVKEETGTEGEQEEKRKVEPNLQPEKEDMCQLPSTLLNLILQRHEGETSGAQCHGEGVAYFERGHMYKGEMFYNQSKTSSYKGDWVKNSREGFGVRCYPSGNIYSGEWRNNLRHGEGTMRWLQLGQEYAGMWQDGVQHGRGTHVWMLRQTDGAQYSQSNRYTGDFVQGQRHGRGTFFYADGAIYEGEWRNDKKHGKGKFTSKDGHVFEGEFVDDHMMTNELNGNRAGTPLCGAPTLSGSASSVFGADVSLNIKSLLDKIPQKKRNTELKQLEFVVLRQDAELRSIYSFYCRLGHVSSSDNTFLLSRLQLWRLLKDCNIHHHGITLTKIDSLIQEDSTTQVQSPFTLIPLRRLLSCLVIVAHHIYNENMESQKYLLASCFSKLMTDDILPNAKNVKGFLFGQPDISAAALNYMSRCWDVYQARCRVHAAPGDDQTMTCRQLLWMFKDLRLLDNNLTTVRLLNIIAAESQEPNNVSSCLNLEITFLEFFEVLLGCAEVKCQQVSEKLEESCSPFRSDAESRDLSKDVRESQQDVKTKVCEEPRSAVHREEHRAERKDMEAKDQTIHQFFNQIFFPAFDHYQLVTKYMEEDKLRQKLNQ